MYRDRRSVIIRIFIVVVGVLAFIGGVAFRLSANELPRPVALMLARSAYFCFVLIGVHVIGYLVFWGIRNRIFDGIGLAFVRARMERNLRKDLLKAGIFFKSYFLGEVVAVIPEIRIDFADDMATGEIFIENSEKFQNKMEKLNISPSLGKFTVIEEPYLTEDENNIVYEIEDSCRRWGLKFQNVKEYITYCIKQLKQQPDNNNFFFINRKWIAIKLASILMCGPTGGGKTCAIVLLVMQSLFWKIKPKYFFADPKESSLFMLGTKICPKRSVTETADIIALLEKFDNEMKRRKKQMKPLLKKKLNGTYEDWNRLYPKNPFPPCIFVIDELSSIIDELDDDRNTKRHFLSLLKRICKKGRQQGFFIWCIAQKSDATDIPTSVRDSLIWKCCVGHAPRTTLQTCFEVQDLPKRKFKAGQGFFSYQGMTVTPQIVSFPDVDFTDMLNAVPPVR